MYLTRAGRALKKKLAPLAQDTNCISIRGLAASEALTAREVLLKMIENLAEGESSGDAD